MSKARWPEACQFTVEEWFKQQDFYANLRFIHGDRIFNRDGDTYKILIVQVAWLAWSKTIWSNGAYSANQSVFLLDAEAYEQCD